MLDLQQNASKILTKPSIWFKIKTRKQTNASFKFNGKKVRKGFKRSGQKKSSKDYFVWW